MRQDYKQDRNSISEDRENLLSDVDLSDPPTYSTSRRPPGWRTVTVLIVCASILAALAGYWTGSRTSTKLDQSCTNHVSQYSPLLRELDISYSVVRFNGSLLKENVFRQDAGPEVDAAWKALGVDYRSVVVPVDQAEESGLLPDQVKISPKYGGGFPANVEGLHHLHCLNLLRKSLYYNFDYYHALGQGPFGNSDFILRKHVSHCLDILRQQLMCSVDIGVMGQVWFQPNTNSPPEAFVDFNTQHKCKNFDAVRRWAEERQLPEHAAVDLLQPPKEGDKIYTTVP
ncbi:hypothetical protein K490DRAFT_32878 [Saccharata proteae CBS 121410]|uniref:Tat pathway signal sequence n=1 Tax=Saccharata proteae CBS 121410 TaxID=1314787 RepID=A0A9P4I4F7_9PEZI|nr:hypothetical protein K490DRAFT_32878 [Saccharata proteae CBS 121410]